MNASEAKDAQGRPGGRAVVWFRLYVAAHTPNADRAISNLESVCQEHFSDRYLIEVVDILEQPLRALSEGVLETPALVRVLPLPVRKIVGDLDETAIVQHALGRE